MLSSRIKEYLDDYDVEVNKYSGNVVIKHPHHIHQIPIAYFGFLLEESYYFFTNKDGVHASKLTEEKLSQFLSEKTWDVWFMEHGYVLTPKIRDRHTLPTTDWTKEWIYIKESDLEFTPSPNMIRPDLKDSLAVCMTLDLKISLTLFEMKQQSIYLIKYPNLVNGIIWPYKFEDETKLKSLKITKRHTYGLSTPDFIICGLCTYNYGYH